MGELILGWAFILFGVALLALCLQDEARRIKRRVREEIARDSRRVARRKARMRRKRK